MVSASVGSQVSGFFSWWGQELLELVPGGARSPAETQTARTVIGLDGDSVRLIETNGPKAAARPDGIVPPPAMIAYLAGRMRSRFSPGPVALRLPFSACFVRRLELPAAAKADFNRLLAVDLERSTPFRLKDVLTAFDTEDGPAGKGMVKVRQLVIKRKIIDALKTDIEALGLKVTRVECSEPNGQAALPLNFLARTVETDNESRRSSPLLWTLGLAGVVLAATATYLYVDRHEQALATLQAETSKLRAKAQLQRDALAKTQTAYAEIASFQKLRTDSVSKVVVLEELTRILPETAWITDLKVDGPVVDISGLAVSAAALVPIMERSKVFVDATSTASLTLDPREEKERFSIRARLRSASAGQVPPAEAVQ